MRLIDAEKGWIAALVDDEWSKRRIENRYSWNKTSVRKFVKEHKTAGKFVTRFSKHGRKRKTSNRTNRLINRFVQGPPDKQRISSEQIVRDFVKNGVHISSRTVRPRAVESGLPSSMAKKEAITTKINVKKTANMG